ncbi:MAG: hypothetical protein LM578_07240 [Desulfurococcaceae archaeon]|jgi:hypothetical protein|nr:hypothetical protein [Desulfurococcaceae archaeon]
MQLYDVERYYLEALREAEELPQIHVGEGTLIAFSRGAEPPAYTLYIATLHAGLKTRIASATEASVHLLPYKDQDRMVLFTLNPKDTRALNTVITAALLNVKVTLVTPPLHEAYEERVRMHDVEVVGIASKHPLLTMTIASLRWTPKLMGFREERVRGEISNLRDALKWIHETYKDTVESGARYEIAAYTPSTRPGAYYYCRATGCHEPLPLEAVAELPRGAKILGLLTTTEEHAYKDLLLLARTQGIQLDTVTFNTDPVTATLYSTLLALATTRKPL